MANGGGNFGGDGSVKWEVTNQNSREKDPKKHAKLNDKGGITCMGIDDEFGQYFVVLIKPQKDDGTPMSAKDFIRSGAIDEYTDKDYLDYVRIRLPIVENSSKQIEVHWDPTFPGTTDPTRATR